MCKKIFTLLIIIMSLMTYVQAQQDCGVVDCLGRCGRFMDSNGDGFCDHGQLSAPKVETVVKEEPKATPEKVKPQGTTGTAKPVQKDPVREQATANSEVQTETEITKPAVKAEPKEQPAAPVKQKSPYSLILISALTLGLYSLTIILVKTKVMKQLTHRRIWNVVLLITGLVSCLLGFFLVIQINYTLKMDWLWTVKLYHVQFGISMTIIAVIHILWHIPYYKNIFTKKTNK